MFRDTPTTLVVAGGGPAGASCASALARAGRAVLLIERDVAPADKLCGDFIGPAAQHYLAGMGFDPLQHGGAPVGRLRLVHGHRMAEAVLTRPGVSLARRRLDAALLDHVSGDGVEVLRGYAITGVRGEAEVTLEVAGIGEMRAATLFLATGKQAPGGVPRLPARVSEELVGLKTYVRLARDAAAGARGACRAGVVSRRLRQCSAGRGRAGQPLPAGGSRAVRAAGDEF